MSETNNATLISLFTNIANAIRERTGKSDKIVADDFPFALASIPNNSVLLSIVDKSITELPGTYLEGITSIGDYAFYGCQNLALTSLPESLTSIGSYAFSGCLNLALTSLPESLTSIGSYAFYSCQNLALTSLPEGITSIGDSAFYYCLKLTNLTFKGTPNRIASSAFYACNQLKTINVPWSEGEVTGAPWGATRATINYNYING